MGKRPLIHKAQVIFKRREKDAKISRNISSKRHALSSNNSSCNVFPPSFHPLSRRSNVHIFHNKQISNPIILPRNNNKCIHILLHLFNAKTHCKLMAPQSLLTNGPCNSLRRSLYEAHLQLRKSHRIRLSASRPALSSRLQKNILGC